MRIIRLSREDLQVGKENLAVEEISLNCFKQSSVSRDEMAEAEIITYARNGAIKTLKSKFATDSEYIEYRITPDQLKDIGFSLQDDEISPYSGLPCNWYMKKDNGHIVEGHDVSHFYLKIHSSSVIIEVEQISSYLSGRSVHFKGRCLDIEFLKQIIDSIAVS